MQKITDEQQLKINKLMNLKYKRHRRMMIWTRFFIVLYSVLVFFLLVHYHQIEYYINGNFVTLLILVFGICFFSFSVGGIDDSFGNGADKTVISIAFVLVVVIVLVVALAGLFCYDEAPIEQVFLIFLVFIGLYFVLCFLGRKTITRTTLLFIYFVFYFLFLSPVLFQALSYLGIFGKIGNFLFGISPIFLVVFRTSLVDMFGSGFFIRKYFLKKDSEIWNCPQCHYHIIKKPFSFCPHCGNTGNGNGAYCENCGFLSKIRDFDFPNYCPHCGLSFRKRRSRK